MRHAAPPDRGRRSRFEACPHCERWGQATPQLSFALLCGSAVAALAAGSWALTSRDA